MDEDQPPRQRAVARRLTWRRGESAIEIVNILRLSGPLSVKELLVPLHEIGHTRKTPASLNKELRTTLASVVAFSRGKWRLIDEAGRFY